MTEQHLDDFRSSKARHRRNSRIVMGVALCLAVFLAVKAYLWDVGGDKVKDAIATVEEMDGYVLVKREAKTVDYFEGGYVISGDMVQTLEDGMLRLRYLDGRTMVEIGPNVTILLSAGESGNHTNLSAGRVKYTIPDHSPQKPMVLQSYNAEAVVQEPGAYILEFKDLGTHYEVLEGKLKVRRFSDSFTREVLAGQTYSCNPEEAATAITFQENL